MLLSDLVTLAFEFGQVNNFSQVCFQETFFLSFQLCQCLFQDFAARS
jgi:hypothetical protein